MRATAVVGQTLVDIVASDPVSTVTGGTRTTVERTRRIVTVNADVTWRGQTLVEIALAHAILIKLPTGVADTVVSGDASPIANQIKTDPIGALGAVVYTIVVWRLASRATELGRTLALVTGRLVCARGAI